MEAGPWDGSRLSFRTLGTRGSTRFNLPAQPSSSPPSYLVSWFALTVGVEKLGFQDHIESCCLSPSDHFVSDLDHTHSGSFKSMLFSLPPFTDWESQGWRAELLRHFPEASRV